MDLRQSARLDRFHPWLVSRHQRMQLPGSSANQGGHCRRAVIMNPNQDPVCVRRIEWRRVLPVLNLWRCVTAGLRIRTLIPATLAICVAAGFRDVVTDSQAFVAGHLFPVPLRGALDGLLGLLLRSDVQPLPLIATIALLLIPVCMISRSAASDAFRNERLGWLAAGAAVLRHSTAIGITTLLAILIGGAVLSTLRISAWVLSPGNSLMIIIAAICLLAAATLFIAWLLSLAAIGIDSCSGSDALSRGLSYSISNKAFTVCCLLIITCLSNGAAFLAGTLQAAAQIVAEHQLSDSAEASPQSNEYPGPNNAILGINAETPIPQQEHLFPMTVQLSVFLSGIGLLYVILRQKEDAVRLDELDGGAQRQ